METRQTAAATDDMGCPLPEAGQTIATIAPINARGERELIELLWRATPDEEGAGRIYARYSGAEQADEWDAEVAACPADDARDHIGAAYDGPFNCWNLDMESYVAE